MATNVRTVRPAPTRPAPVPYIQPNEDQCKALLLTLRMYIRKAQWRMNEVKVHRWPHTASIEQQ